MFDAVIAGGLPKPAWLAETQNLWPQWKSQSLERAAKGLTRTTFVHICHGYGIKANLDLMETLNQEWRQYEAIFPAIAASDVLETAERVA